MLSDWLEALMAVGAIILSIILILLPFIVTLIVGVTFANMLGFTGIVWWSFVLLFLIVVGALCRRVMPDE